MFLNQLNMFLWKILFYQKNIYISRREFSFSARDEFCSIYFPSALGTSLNTRAAKGGLRCVGLAAAPYDMYLLAAAGRRGSLHGCFGIWLYSTCSSELQYLVVYSVWNDLVSNLSKYALYPGYKSSIFEVTRAECCWETVLDSKVENWIDVVAAFRAPVPQKWLWNVTFN